MVSVNHRKPQQVKGRPTDLGRRHISVVGRQHGRTHALRHVHTIYLEAIFPFFPPSPAPCHPHCFTPPPRATTFRGKISFMNKTPLRGLMRASSHSTPAHTAAHPCLRLCVFCKSCTDFVLYFQRVSLSRLPISRRVNKDELMELRSGL